jgi:hypothetical protein
MAGSWKYVVQQQNILADEAAVAAAHTGTDLHAVRGLLEDALTINPLEYICLLDRLTFDSEWRPVRLYMRSPEELSAAEQAVDEEVFCILRHDPSDQLVDEEDTPSGMVKLSSIVSEFAEGNRFYAWPEVGEAADVDEEDTASAGEDDERGTNESDDVVEMPGDKTVVLFSLKEGSPPVPCMLRTRDGDPYVAGTKAVLLGQAAGQHMMVKLDDARNLPPGSFGDDNHCTPYSRTC